MNLFENATEFSKFICHKYLVDRDYSIFETVLDERFHSIGTGSHEICRNINEFVESMNREEIQWDGSFLIDEEWYQETRLTATLFLVIGEVKGQEDAKDRIIYDFEFRFTLIVEKQTDGWKMIHVHQSVPDANQGTDEFFPKRIVEQSNQKLRENIAKKTKELQESHKAVLYYSQHDYLTNLMNRYYGEKIIQDLIAQKKPGVMIVIDVDNFKTCNDTYGHPAGDQLLIKLAESMKKAMDAEVLSRIGGDEFLIYTTKKVNCQDIKVMLIAMRNAWIDSQSELGFEKPFDISMGISCYPRDGIHHTQLMKHADTALYQSKSKDSFFVCYSQDEM